MTHEFYTDTIGDETGDFMVVVVTAPYRVHPVIADALRVVGE